MECFEIVWLFIGICAFIKFFYWLAEETIKHEEQYKNNNEEWF